MSVGLAILAPPRAILDGNRVRGPRRFARACAGYHPAVKSARERRLRAAWLPILILGALPFLSGLGQRNDGPVVVYLVDTLRPDRMSAYGAARDTTPAVRAFASESVVFRNAFTLSTWTRPAVATLLTSRLPSEVGAINRYGRLSESVPYLPEIFQKHGWVTCAAVANGNVDDPRLGFRRGFDRFDDVWGKTPEEKPSAVEVVEKARAFIAAQPSPRFFLYVHVIDPHIPYRTPPEFQTAFEASAGPTPREKLLLEYDREVRTSDEGFLHLADSLKAKGWWRDALVVFVSDHGEEFYEHGNLYHGATLYDEQTRVPLVVKFPGNEGRATTRPDPVSLADVAPTIVDAMGWEKEKGWIGESVRGRRFPENREIYATEDLDAFRLYGLRRGPEKVIVRVYPTLERRVFRLDRDPRENEGASVPCGEASAGSASDLLPRLEAWRERDLEGFPQVHLWRSSPGEEVRIDLLVSLGGGTKPFLSATDACRYASSVKPGMIMLRGPLSPNQPFDFRIAGDDRGALPHYRLGVTDSRGKVVPLGDARGVTVRAAQGDFLTGLTVDETEARRLKALGYLAGD